MTEVLYWLKSHSHWGIMRQADTVYLFSPWKEGVRDPDRTAGSVRGGTGGHREGWWVTENPLQEDPGPVHLCQHVCREGRKLCSHVQRTNTWNGHKVAWAALRTPWGGVCTPDVPPRGFHLPSRTSEKVLASAFPHAHRTPSWNLREQFLRNKVPHFSAESCIMEHLFMDIILY